MPPITADCTLRHGNPKNKIFLLLFDILLLKIGISGGSVLTSFFLKVAHMKEE
jgi:hypothetical protein